MMTDIFDGTHTWICENCMASHQSKSVNPSSGYVLYSKKCGEWYACSAVCARGLLGRMIDAAGGK